MFSEQNQNHPAISIIILTFNGSTYITPLLQSILDQSYPQDRIEIIIVDNASTDNTLAIVQEDFTSAIIVPLEKNIGFAAGNNQGLLHASHDFIVFLNQDTVCHRDFLKSLVRIMATDKRIAACNPNIIATESKYLNNIDSRPIPESLYICDLSPFGYGQNRIIDGRVIFYTKLLSGCAFMIRRETVSKLGYLYDDQFWMYAEDTDLSLRLHNMDQKICAVQDSIVYHLHNTNIALKKNSLHLAARAIMNRTYAYFKNMGSFEFMLFFPLLLLGGNFKFFEFPLKPFKKMVYFFPFSLFSMACTMLAVFGLPKFVPKKRRVINARRVKGFPILKLVLKQGR